MAEDKKISDLAIASDLTGAELIEVVQGGVNKQSTTGAVVINKADAKVTTRSITGNHTLDSADLTSVNTGKTLIIEGDGTGDATVPLNSSIAFAVGSVVGLRGFDNVVETGGVTVTGTRGDLTIPSGQTVILEKTGTNTWILNNGTAGGTGSQDLASVLGEGNDGGGLQIKNIADPTNDQDAATKKYVDDNAGSGGVTTWTFNRPDLSSTTDYTLVLADGDGKTIVEMDKATACNLNIPTNASVAIPVGREIPVIQRGAGVCTIVPAGGVTLRSIGSRTKTFGQYSVSGLIKVATNEWYYYGDITT